MRVKSCEASDDRNRPIQLSDQNGCVLRPKMISKFMKMRSSDARATVVTYAFFHAFKFPDSMAVQIRCKVRTNVQWAKPRNVVFWIIERYGWLDLRSTTLFHLILKVFGHLVNMLNHFPIVVTDQGHSEWCAHSSTAIISKVKVSAFLFGNEYFGEDVLSVGEKSFSRHFLWGSPLFEPRFSLF